MNFTNPAPLHQPVLLQEVLQASSQTQARTLLDCTFGRGGHSLAFLEKFPNLKILALDQDSEAVDYGRGLEACKQGQIHMLKANFHKFPEEAGRSALAKFKKFDIILLDLGVSSPQLDREERGFSFYSRGPLDMRMDREQQETAGDILNSYSKDQLISLFKDYGEIKRPYPVVDSIFKERKKKRLETTEDFVNIIHKHVFRRRGGLHPATPYFLALRMKVNNELDGLASIKTLSSYLNEQACMLVITFHSLEDRIVKNIFKELVKEGQGTLWNKKVIRPSLQESQRNPRSRSAKLRVFQQGGSYA